MDLPHSTAGAAEPLRKGRLEYREWARLLWALEEVDGIAAWLSAAGNVRPATEPDVRVQTTSAPAINLPATWLALDEIIRHQRVIAEFRTLDELVRDPAGAYAGAEFGRCVADADRRWPREERPHEMRSMRCGGCDQLTLVYRPPRFPGDVITVPCRACSFVLGEDDFSVAALLIEAEIAGRSTAIEAAEAPEEAELVDA